MQLRYHTSCVPKSAWHLVQVLCISMQKITKQGVWQVPSQPENCSCSQVRSCCCATGDFTSRCASTSCRTVQAAQ